MTTTLASICGRPLVVNFRVRGFSGEEVKDPVESEKRFGCDSHDFMSAPQES
jgi:hypothetical protein